MASSLRMQDLSLFVRRMRSKRNFQPLKLLNKMGWLRGRIGWFKKWQELCYSTSKFLKSFGRKSWTPLVTLVIEYSSERDTYEIWNGKKPKVKYFRVFGSKSYILNDWENLGKFDAKVMKASSLVILPLAEHIESSTREQR